MQAFLLLAGMSSLLLSVTAVAIEPEAACSVEGELVHWIADYCMLEAETDDEIAVSQCINKQSRAAFRTTCFARLHFKRAMCTLVVARGTKKGPVEQCMEDPNFMGYTVKNKGVGG